MNNTTWDKTRGPEKPTRTIWKYRVPVLEDFTLDLPKGAEVIRFANEAGQLWLWAIVAPYEPAEPRRFLAFKTGAEMPIGDNIRYLGCAASHIQQELMLYYFEVTQ